MKFLSITGPKADIDRVVNEYLAKYEIHLENALAQLSEVKHVTPYVQVNPYRDLLNKATEFASLLKDAENIPTHNISLSEATELLGDLDRKLTSINAKSDELTKQRNALAENLNCIAPFRKLPENLNKLFHYNYVRVRFGRISKEYYTKFTQYAYDNLDTFFYPCHEDEYVWGAYFVPRTKMTGVDAVFSSMHFERIYLPDNHFDGTAEQLCADLQKQIDDIDRQLSKYNEERSAILQDKAGSVLSACTTLNTLSANFDVRKVAACVKEHDDTFYMLCGWMSEKDVKDFQHDIEDDSQIFCIVEEEHDASHGTPPTKLKNPKLFKPFEMFIKMYGLPAYDEMDPTMFVALTYIFIFGAMFGDVGQGLCLLIGGLLLYKFKKMDLAAIIGCAGIFSTIFGFLFGSFFGFEDVIPALWLHPTEAMSKIPGLGNMNTVFVVAIAFGMFLILVTMIFHVVNAIRRKDIENILFDQNAISGLVFYGSLILVIALFISGNKLPAGIVLGIMFGIPLILIMLKEPLTRMINKKTPAIEGSKPMFFVQSFFELFEVMLSYLSNTLSFVRIGAFAVSHAAMMGVVLMLAGAESGGSTNWLVIVLGNIFVCAMEGLIVGIQVLRLEYYELFSRFYTGSGHEFKPFLKRTENIANENK